MGAVRMDNLETTMQDAVMQVCRHQVPFKSYFDVIANIQISVDESRSIVINIKERFVKKGKERSRKSSQRLLDKKNAENLPVKKNNNARKSYNSAEAKQPRKYADHRQKKTSLELNLDVNCRQTRARNYIMPPVKFKQTKVLNDDQKSSKGAKDHEKDGIGTFEEMASLVVHQPQTAIIDERLQLHDLVPDISTTQDSTLKVDDKAKREHGNEEEAIDLHHQQQDDRKPCDQKIHEDQTMHIIFEVEEEKEDILETLAPPGFLNSKRSLNKCTLCNGDFKSQRDLSQHQEANHREDLPFKCSDCGRRFEGELECKSHSDLHRKHMCEVCGKTYKTERLFNNHMSLHLDRKPYSCNECGKSFTNKRSLMIHRRDHTGETPYQCSQCDKAFKSWQNLNSHRMYNHLKNRNFQCQFCGKSFITRKSQMYHERVHTGEKQYKCVPCDKKFVFRRSLINHHKIVHEGVRNFQCHLCGNTFTSQTGVKNHVRNIHQAEKQYKCDKCDQTFRFRSNMTKHVIEKHGKINFKCRFCDHQYMLLRDKKQCEMEHTNGKPHVCQVCGKSFKLKKTLQSHEVVHTGVKAFKCEICGRAFTQKSNMQVHMLTHSNEKRFICHHCNLGFKHNAALKRHIPSCPSLVKPKYPIVKVSTEKGKMHACGICEKLYDRPNKVRRHILSQHRHIVEQEDGEQIMGEQTLNGQALNGQALNGQASQYVGVAQGNEQILQQSAKAEINGVETGDVQTLICTLPSDMEVATDMEGQSIQTVCTIPNDVKSIHIPPEGLEPLMVGANIISDVQVTDGALQHANVIFIPNQAHMDDPNIQHTVLEVASSQPNMDTQSIQHIYVIQESTVTEPAVMEEHIIPQ